MAEPGFKPLPDAVKEYARDVVRQQITTDARRGLQRAALVGVTYEQFVVNFKQQIAGNAQAQQLFTKLDAGGYDVEDVMREMYAEAMRQGQQ